MRVLSSRMLQDFDGMSLTDAGAPQLLVLCRNVVDGDEKALEVNYFCGHCPVVISSSLQRLLAVINSGGQEQVQAAYGPFNN